MFFKHIEAAPADPILGLGEAFKAETRPEKVNLGIGVYKDASGATPIVKAVKEAEKRLLESETTKNYLTIDGVADYNEQTQILLFGKDHEIIASRRAKTAQSLGGTGALRIATEFAKRQLNAQPSGFPIRLGQTTTPSPKRSASKTNLIVTMMPPNTVWIGTA